MRRFFVFLLTLSGLVWAQAPLENTACKTCHPAIYSEYQNSMHSKASIFTDAIHKAVWDKHPAKEQGTYTCAKCHSPSDPFLKEGKGVPADNTVQQTEPISCQSCHRIESIEKHTKANTNVMTQKKKYFYSADKKKKGTKMIFKETSSFFGLIKSTSGSPYHDIDYSNEIYYNGEACMGCHAHKQNDNNFAICDLEVKQGDSKATCTTCHMPQTIGALANQKRTATHAYHGASIHGASPKHLSQYVELDLKQRKDGFAISIHNKATHTLFPHPLRLNQLRVRIRRAGKDIILPVQSFARVIGKNGKPTMPWLANSIVEDTTIKALETRHILFKEALQKGDEVFVEFGYYVVDPKTAEMLEIKEPKTTEFIVLTQKSFDL
jgi:hypothetical protein